MPWSRVQPVLTDPRIEQALQFARSPHGPVRGVEFCRSQMELPPEKLDPPALLNGDILREQGFQPGPRFADVLREVRRAQLDGDITTSDEALQIAREMLGQPD